MELAWAYGTRLHLRRRINEASKRARALGPRHILDFCPDPLRPASVADRGPGGQPPSRVVHKLRLAMMTGGVDFNGSPGGIASATHGEAELEDTLTTLRKSVRMLKQEGEI